MENIETLRWKLYKAEPHLVEQEIRKLQAEEEKKKKFTVQITKLLEELKPLRCTFHTTETQANKLQLVLSKLIKCETYCNLLKTYCSNSVQMSRQMI